MINLNAYYNKILSGFPDDQEQGNAIVDSLKSSVDAYLLEHPEATLDNLYETFGTPEEVIKQADLPSFTAIKKAKTRKRWIIGVTIGVLTVLFFGFVVSQIMKSLSAENGHAVAEGGEITTSGTATTITGRST